MSEATTEGAVVVAVAATRALDQELAEMNPRLLTGELRYGRLERDQIA